MLRGDSVVSKYMFSINMSLLLETAKDLHYHLKSRLYPGVSSYTV